MLATGNNAYKQTGAAVWHWRAWRRQRAWEPFCRWVDDAWQDWLSDAGTEKKADRTARTTVTMPLLVMGPSAGWTLPDGFAARFDPVIGIDIDPLAHRLFRWRHPGTSGQSLIWHTADFVTELPRLLNQWPDASLLFANCLGQLGLLHDNPANTETALNDLTDALQGRHWFSYHDRLSLHFPSAVPARTVQALDKALSSLQSHSAIDPDSLMRIIGPVLSSNNHDVLRCSITDHLTTHLLPNNRRRRYSLLPVTSRALHIIEAG